MRNSLRHIVSVGAACLCWLAAALFASPAAAGPNRWTAIGPDGANVVALVIDPRIPTTAFAGTQGSGILKTMDGGATWATVNVALPTKNILALAIDPATTSTIYAGTDVGVFKSTDGGQSWAAANVGLANMRVSALAIDSGSPAAVYVGTAGGVFKTIDAAATWTPINAGLTGLYPRAIAIDPISPSTVYVVVYDYVGYVNNGVVKSTDGGTTWAKIYTTPQIPFDCCSEVDVTAIAIDPSAPNRLYLAFFTGGTLYADVLRSADGGASWYELHTPQHDLGAIAVDPTSSTTLYAGTYSGVVLRSTDTGDHWAPVTSSPLASDSIVALALTASSPGTVYASGGNGIFRSLDSAQTWARLTLGIRDIGVNAVAFDPTTMSTVYAAAAYSVVAKTTDGGIHWTDSRLGISGEYVQLLAIDPAMPSTVYAAGSRLYKSADAGRGWAPLPVGSRYSFFPAVVIAPSQHSTLYAAVGSGEFGADGVWKSVDGGFSWTRADSGLPLFNLDITALAVDPSNADIVYAANYVFPNAKIYKSTDGASQWRQVPITLPRETSVKSLAIDPVTPSNIYAAFDIFDVYGDYGGPFIAGVVKSSDSGETWPSAPGLLPSPSSIFALAIDPHTPSQIYAATSSGVYMSADSATNWTPMNSGLPNLYVTNIAIDKAGTVLRAATPAGLFEYRVSGPPVAATVSVVEYVHAGFGHYFITSGPDEIAKLDNGTFVGWARTGSEFNAFAAPSASSAPVCRFFSTAFGLKSSHFYTPFAAECAMRRADPAWLLESADAFDIAVPAADGSCAGGFAPVYRLYNNGQGGAPNHRYTTDVIVRAQMTAQGWMPEGLGPDAVQMCSPP